MAARRGASMVATWEVSSATESETEDHGHAPTPINWEQHEWGGPKDKSRDATLKCANCNEMFDQRAVYISQCVNPQSGAVNKCAMAYCGPCLVAKIDSDKHAQAQRALKIALRQPGQHSRLDEIVKTAFKQGDQSARTITCPLCRNDGERKVHKLNPVDFAKCIDSFSCQNPGCTFEFKVRTQEHVQKSLVNLYGKVAADALPQLKLPTRPDMLRAMAEHGRNCVFKRSSDPVAQMLEKGSLIHTYLVRTCQEHDDTEMQMASMTSHTRDIETLYREMQDERDKWRQGNWNLQQENERLREQLKAATTETEKGIKRRRTNRTIVP